MDFPNLYKQEFAYAWRTLRRLGVRDRDLPDLAHDFFIVVYRHLSEYDRSRPLRPWLFGIAFRTVSDYRRSARFKRESLDDAPDVVDRAPPVDEQIEERQAREAVMRVLEALDLDRRVVFVMHDLEGQPVPEIASALWLAAATRLISALSPTVAVGAREPRAPVPASAGRGGEEGPAAP